MIQKNGNPPPTTPNSQASLNPIQAYTPKPAQPKPTLGLAKLSKICSLDRPEKLKI